MNYMALDDCYIILTVQKSELQKFKKRPTFFVAELVTNRMDSNELNTPNLVANLILQYRGRHSYKLK